MRTLEAFLLVAAGKDLPGWPASSGMPCPEPAGGAGGSGCTAMGRSMMSPMMADMAAGRSTVV
jgi:hypothetical protein